MRLDFDTKMGLLRTYLIIRINMDHQMARANRHFLSGYVWHITHLCHKKILFKLVKDRERFLYWLFQAKKRYVLCILNYIVTSNHIHLFLYDKGRFFAWSDPKSDPKPMELHSI